jgi:SPP1 gp7 family putative phage head morphogenesis protein
MTAIAERGPVSTRRRPVRWWREPNEREKIARLDEIEGRWDEHEDDYVRAILPLMLVAIDALADQADVLLRSGELSELTQLQNRGQFGRVYSGVASQLSRAISFGQKQAARVAGEQRMAIPDALLSQWVDVAAHFQARDDLNAAQITFISALVNSLASNDRATAVEDGKQAAIEWAEPKMQRAARVRVAEAINFGREDARRNLRGIQGVQISAILDDRTCPLCHSLDGMTLAADDPRIALWRPPFHDRCRCLQIFVGEEEIGFVPQWSDPGEELLRRHGRFVIERSPADELHPPFGAI